MTESFSIVIPTYTGASTIDKTFDSILKQSPSSLEYEVVVVIDGPNKRLRHIVEKYEDEFRRRRIGFTIYQSEKNKGRFDARISGAELSKNEQLLFVDDRAQLTDRFLEHLDKLDGKTALPGVQEHTGNNVITKTMNILRRQVYGNKGGLRFKDYYIDKTNFEDSPKGTTCLWIDKKIFLAACLKVKKNEKGDSRFVNEDTKVLREIVESGVKILRTPKLNIYYQPRDDFSASLKHLYDRGPRFIDYYHQPGTRFFPVLISIYVLLVSLVLITIFKPGLLYWVAGGLAALTALISVAISKNIQEVATSLIGLPLIGLSFSLGVLKGTLLVTKRLLII